MATPKSFAKLPGLEDEFDQIEKLAVGGMAEVYRARQKSLDRAVAIKKIRPEYQSNADLSARFLREARGAGSFLHQNLAHVYDYKSISGHAYIIMEYIDGFDLAEILQAAGVLPLDVACMIATKVLLGLAYVHSHGTVHRDLKPDNIRVTVRGEVKIMDFGIALEVDERNLTQPGVVVGSPHYLSPEQVTGSRIDHRSDIFSFGITFYEMLTGKRPFTESTKQTLFEKIREGKYEPVQKLRPDAPGLVVSLIDRCLRVNPGDRPSSVESLAAILQEYVHSQFGTAFEARIRKFLMERDLLQGNPESILIHEKTAEVRASRFALLKKRLMAPAGYLLAGVVVGYFAHASIARFLHAELPQRPQLPHLNLAPPHVVMPPPSHVAPAGPSLAPITPAHTAAPHTDGTQPPAHAPLQHHESPVQTEKPKKKHPHPVLPGNPVHEGT